MSKDISINFTDESCTNPFAAAFEEELWKTARVVLKKKKFLNMETICKVRSAFLTSWVEKGYNDKFKNILIDYHQRVYQAGFSDLYTYWLMKEGDKKAFLEWKIEHEQEYNDFIIWLEANPLRPGNKNCFYRMQYN